MILRMALCQLGFVHLGSHNVKRNSGIPSTILNRHLVNKDQRLSFSTFRVYQQRPKFTLTKVKLACIFPPQTAGHVSTALRALVATKEKFAIRSGGRAPLEKSNNIHGGVTIDLSYLDSIQYDTDSELVTFGPGVRWKHVYRELAYHGTLRNNPRRPGVPGTCRRPVRQDCDIAKHNRVVAGGREGETGVAGFLLGGGNTWFTA
ncbi:hypothetical protein CHU98_g3600 [Xylaria longipes]|nr:hypothetical protein CHU98_g3600 [Xylaria longipes]